MSIFIFYQCSWKRRRWWFFEMSGGKRKEVWTKQCVVFHATLTTPYIYIHRYISAWNTRCKLTAHSSSLWSLTSQDLGKIAMANYIGNKFGQQDVDKLVRAFLGVAQRKRCIFRLFPNWLMAFPVQKEFEKRVDPNDRGAQALLEEMRQHVKKVSWSLLSILAREICKCRRRLLNLFFPFANSLCSWRICAKTKTLAFHFLLLSSKKHSAFSLTLSRWAAVCIFIKEAGFNDCSILLLVY